MKKLIEIEVNGVPQEQATLFAPVIKHAVLTFDDGSQVMMRVIFFQRMRWDGASKQILWEIGKIHLIKIFFNLPSDTILSLYPYHLDQLSNNAFFDRSDCTNAREAKESLVKWCTEHAVDGDIVYGALVTLIYPQTV
jgi:hypothetical protein